MSCFCNTNMGLEPRRQGPYGPGVMSKLEVLRFIFGTLDTERQSFITREDFDNMCDVLMEHERNPHSMRRIRVLFDKHAKEGLSGNPELFFEGFFDLMKAYEPPWPVRVHNRPSRYPGVSSKADLLLLGTGTRSQTPLKRALWSVKFYKY